MHPTTTHMQAHLHIEELLRQAADHRVVAAHRATTAHHRPALHARAGALLVHVGSRLQGDSPGVASHRNAGVAVAATGSTTTANGTC